MVIVWMKERKNAIRMRLFGFANAGRPGMRLEGSDVEWNGEYWMEWRGRDSDVLRYGCIHA